jgi:hypothetical protein
MEKIAKCFLKKTVMNKDNPVDIMDIKCSIKFLFMNVKIADTNIMLLNQVRFIIEINPKIPNKIIH